MDTLALVEQSGVEWALNLILRTRMGMSGTRRSMPHTTREMGARARADRVPTRWASGESGRVSQVLPAVACRRRERSAVGATAATAAHIGGRIGKVHRRREGREVKRTTPDPAQNPSLMENIFHERWRRVEREMAEKICERSSLASFFPPERLQIGTRT